MAEAPRVVIDLTKSQDGAEIIDLTGEDEPIVVHAMRYGEGVVDMTNPNDVNRFVSFLTRTTDENDFFKIEYRYICSHY